MRTVGALDHADLGETARQFGRRGHVLCQRFDAFRQRRVGRVDRGAGPAHGGIGIDRRVEVVAERGAERLFIALGHRDAVDHRRPQVLGLAVQQL